MRATALRQPDLTGTQVSGGEPLRICYQFNPRGTELGGAARAARLLLQAMLSVDVAATYCTVAPTLRGRVEVQQVAASLGSGDRLSLRWLPIPNTIWEWSQTKLALPAALFTGPYDVFHLHLLPFRPRVAPHRLVISIHDTTGLIWPDDEGGLPNWTQALLQQCAAVLTVSEYSKSQIIEKLRVVPGRVHVIPNGCDHTVFHPNHHANEIHHLLAQLNIPAPYLLHTGGKTPRKNVPCLIKGFASFINETGSAHHLVLAGPTGGAHRQAELQQLIAQSGMSDRIHSIGYVTEIDLARLMVGADALVYPSLYEGFGMPVIEAMACGTPVITSNVTALPEVAGRAAHLVDPNNPADIARGISTVVTDVSLREELRSRGLKRAQEFSWDRSAAATLAVYREIAVHKR